MVKRKRDSIPALVLEVIARVYEFAERRTQPWYIDRAALNLGRPPESVDSSIYYAEVSGCWWALVNPRRAWRLLPTVYGYWRSAGLSERGRCYSLDGSELVTLCGIAFKRYPHDAAAGIRPLFDHIKFASIAPRADWAAITKRQRGNRVKKIYRQVH
jgi:hypothetical protein